MSHIIGIKKLLDGIIDTLANHPNDYVKNSGRDFTRNRKLGLAKTVKLILSMGGEFSQKGTL